MYWHVIAYYQREARKHVPVCFTYEGPTVKGYSSAKAIRRYSSASDALLHAAFTEAALAYFKLMKKPALWGERVSMGELPIAALTPSTRRNIALNLTQL
jgi:hypothetical protein